MFERFAALLRTIGVDEDGERASSGRDPRVAAAALLCHVAEADGTTSEAELARLRISLAEVFGLDARDAREAARVARAGREADADAVDLFHFTSVLMAALDAPQRVHFVELLWEVVYTDGAVHELEDNTIWRVAELLGVATRDRMLAKQAAAARASRTIPVSSSGEP